MRIAMVGPFGFHPNKTMRSRALGLARPLAMVGHAVQIFMPPWQTPEKADSFWEEDSVSVRYVSLRGGTLGTTRNLVKEILAWQPDVVHCFKPKAYSGLAAWWLWYFQRKRLRLIVDADDWEGWGGWNELASYTPLQKRFFAWQEHWGMRHCHQLTVASRALQTLAWGQGLPPDHVVYIPNGAGISKNNKQVALAKEQPTILLYSRLFEFDVSRLVAVLRGVKTAVPDLRILSVGTGLNHEDSNQFRQQLAAVGLLEIFDDKGWVAESALPDLLRQADMGLYLMDDGLLNRTKCPVKLADMVMLGIPVVGESVGQVPEYVVHGQTGFLSKTGDVKNLVEAICHLLQNKQECDRLSANAKQHYEENFDWSIQAKKLEQVYSGSD